MRLFTFALLFFLFGTTVEAQEVIISGETMYHSNFGIINSSILNSNIKKAEKQGKKPKAPVSSLRFVRSDRSASRFKRTTSPGSHAVNHPAITTRACLPAIACGRSLISCYPNTDSPRKMWGM